MKIPEPFGYFKVEPFGWTDCAETDEGARPLYEQATVDELTKQRDELMIAARSVLSWTDAGNRPPVRDVMEHGRSASVRVHAMADLNDAVNNVQKGCKP